MTTAQVAERLVWPITHVRPAPDNPRDTLGELAELTNSIEESGIWQSLLVRHTGEFDGEIEIVELIAGHRRRAAAELAELTHVPIEFHNDLPEVKRVTAFFDENFHRLDLGPLERARALQQIADAIAAENGGKVDQRAVAKKAGVSQPTVSKSLALLKLPEKAQGMVVSGVLSQEDAAVLAGLPDDTKTALVEAVDVDDEDFDWEIKRARRLLDNERARAKAEKDARAQGWQVLDEDPQNSQQLGLSGDDKPVSLDEDRHNPYGLLAHVDPKEHTAEDCHAVFVEDDGTLTHACSNPSAHPKPEGWKSPAETERAAAVKAGGATKKAVNRSSPMHDQWERRRKARAETEVRLSSLVELCKSAVWQEEHVSEILDFAVPLTIDYDNEIEWPKAKELLGLPSRGYGTDEVIEAIRGDGGIDGMTVMLAQGLTVGLQAAEELGTALAAGEDPAESDVGIVRATLELLATIGVEGTPTYDELSLVLKTGAADGTITCDVYEHKGKWKRRCTACGELAGVNTKKDLADGRAADHLRDDHGIAQVTSEETTAA